VYDIIDTIPKQADFKRKGNIYKNIDRMKKEGGKYIEQM
jgi:DNA-binding PadR family transcriptional regulator